MQAIITHFIPPTNSRVARIAARASGGTRLVLSYPKNMEIVDAHRMVALALCRKLEWTASANDLVTGYFEGLGYVHVLSEAPHA